MIVMVSLTINMGNMIVMVSLTINMGNMIVMLMPETICMHTKCSLFNTCGPSPTVSCIYKIDIKKNDTVQFICLQLNQV